MGTPLKSPSALVESTQQIARGAGSMGILRLPLVAELRDGSLLACGDEDRVVAEALVAARLAGDPAYQDAGAAQLLAGRRECDPLPDVPGAAAYAPAGA
jgi:hypothetical protein